MGILDSNYKQMYHEQLNSEFSLKQLWTLNTDVHSSEEAIDMQTKPILSFEKVSKGICHSWMEVREVFQFK